MKYIWILFVLVGSIHLIAQDNTGWVYVAIAVGLCLVNVLKSHFPYYPLDGED